MVQITKIDPAHVAEIEAIEKVSFSAPFSREMFIGMMEGRPFGGLSAFEGEKLKGYLFYSIAADQMELVTIAVEEGHRRRGIARKLIAAMIDIARENAVKEIFLEVRLSNKAAQTLYSSLGFVQVAIRKRYYRDNDEDALVMTKKVETYLM